MSEKINLNEIKRQVYLYYSEDGLVDLAIGIVIFGFGALLLVDQPAFVGVLGSIPLLVWYLGKHYLTMPRMGSIQPSTAMKKRFSGFFTMIVIIGIGLFVLYLLSWGSGMRLNAGDSLPLTSYILALAIAAPLSLFGFVLALAISAIGLMMKTNRYYIYGLLVFIAMSLGEFLNRTVESIDVFLLAVIIAGVLIIISGIIVLSRFLAKYPVVRMDG
jgi:hypothetical protein